VTIVGIKLTLRKGTIGPARNHSLCPRTGKNNRKRPRGRTKGRTMNGPVLPDCHSYFVQTVSWSQTLIVRFAFVLSCAILPSWPEFPPTTNSDSIANKKLFHRVISLKEYDRCYCIIYKNVYIYERIKRNLKNSEK